MELILASGSARRRELMTACGYEFTVIPSRADEDIEFSSPQELVRALSLKKAEAVFLSLPSERKTNAVVVGSDTVVTLGGELLEKPASPEEARDMLRRESGRVNVVLTGLAVVRMGENGELVRSVTHDSASVRFAPLSEEEIDAYVATGDPLDKAGAYGIQGPFSMFVESVEGSYFTVVGLPVHLLYRELKKAGVTPRMLGITQNSPDFLK